MADHLRARLIGLLLLAAVLAAPLGHASENAPATDVTGLRGEIGRKLDSVSVSDCLRQGLEGTGSYSVLGRPMAKKVYAPKPPKRPLGKILVIGGIHGDEYSSVSVVFKWMDILNVHHSGLFHWHFIPLSNPDGLLRKKSQRRYENGVDLNRNFPTACWEDLSDAYWTTRTGRDPQRYPGPQAASESEVAYLVQEINEFQPDIIISMHAPYGLIDHDGPPKAPQRLGSPP